VSDRFEAVPESEYAALRAAQWGLSEPGDTDFLGIATDVADGVAADTLAETEPNRERFVKEEQHERE
jgi:hypothetical protein